MNIAQKASRFSRLMQNLELIGEGAGHLFWPRVCYGCDKPIIKSDDGLCVECWGRLNDCVCQEYCKRCGSHLGAFDQLANSCTACEGKKFHFDGIIRAGIYKDILRDIVLNLKYNDQPELVRYLGPLVDAAVSASGFVDEIDMYVPVPLHWRRRLWRGFNQSKLLCEQITVSGKVVNSDMIRIRYTSRQWHLSRSDRRKNVAGAFTVRADHKFSDKTVCIVDDITTSGATLNECARTLKQAGAKKVYALVVAVAVTKK